MPHRASERRPVLDALLAYIRNAHPALVPLLFLCFGHVLRLRRAAQCRRGRRVYFYLRVSAKDACKSMFRAFCLGLQVRLC